MKCLESWQSIPEHSKCELDLGHTTLKCKYVQNIVTLTFICVKLYQNQSVNEEAGTFHACNSQGGESRGLNDRVHGISCRYLDKTCKKMNYISTNTYSIIMQ